MDTTEPFRESGAVQLLPALPLYWRVCLINGSIFLAGTVVLVVSPATVSPEPTVGEIAVLATGLLVILALNALLLRHVLVPLDRLQAAMRNVDLLQPRQRVPMSGNATIRPLISGFNLMLDRLEAERRTSTETALAAQEAERERIGRELHDDIGQQLTVVLLALKRAIERAPEDLAEDLRMVREATRAGLENVRQVARRLRPDVLDDLGLASALRGLASDFSRYSGLPVLRRIDGRPVPFPHATELAVYRVAQEALTNAARHAQATAVELTLAIQAGEAVLVVADDGIGLDQTLSSTGIRGMRERALLVGAALTVTGGPERGTSVRMVIPLAQDRERPAA